MTWNYGRFLSMELLSLTGLNVEIFDENGQKVAGSLEAVNQIQYGDLLDGVSDECQPVSLDGQERFALFMPFFIRENRYNFAIIGAKDRLEMLCKPIREIIRLHLDKETTFDGNSHKGMISALFEALLFNESIDDNVIRQSVSLGLNLQSPHIVAVIALYLLPHELKAGLGEFTPQLEERLINEIEKNMHAEDVTVMSPSHRNIIAVCDAKNKDSLKEIVKSTLELISQELSATLCAGISNPTGGYGDFHRAYTNAAAICRLAAQEKGPGVYTQDELSLELLIDSIPYEVKMNFVEKFFHGCDDADIYEWDQIIRILYDNNGSIGKSAEQLFIHKNTLQYRLNRIRERTGYDARNFMDAVPLQIAFHIHKNIEYSH